MKKIIATSQEISDITTTKNITAATTTTTTTTDNISNRSKPLSQAPRQPAKVKRGDWNFDVDYNDHFETPEAAYSDLLPMIDSWCKLNGKYDTLESSYFVLYYFKRHNYFYYFNCYYYT
jgi:hypothetical protein